MGYSTKHGNDVKRFLNIKTGRIIHSRDVQWLDKMYAESENIKRKVPLIAEFEDVSDQEIGREKMTKMKILMTC